MTNISADLFGWLKEIASRGLNRPGPVRLVEGLSRRAGWLVLVLGLAVFLLAQGYVTIYPLLKKEVPPEADDAFAYITKAVQMKECFTQDCPALVDLQSQIDDRRSGVRPFLKFQIFSKTILIYHPLHSAAMIGLNRLGLSWEEAYYAIWVAAFIFVTAASVYLLTALFGPGGAGIALIILPFFRKDGLDFMVPNHMVMALGLALWAAILTRVRGLGYLIVLGTLCMLSLHVISLLHVVLVLALYWLSASKPLKKERVWVTLVCLGMLAIRVLLPMVVSKPVSDIGSLADTWFSPLTIFPANLKAVVTTMIIFTETYGGYVICGLLLGMGSAFNNPERRHRVVLVFWLCLGLVVASFLPRTPLPGNVFLRVQTPVFILLCGLMGRAGWVWLKDFSSWLWETLTESRHSNEKRGPFIGLGRWRTAGLVLIGFVLFRVVVFGGINFWAATKPVVDHVISRKDFRFYPEQVELLSSQARPGDVIFYRNLEPMQYYLNHGALKYGAVINMLLSKDPVERKKWLENYHPAFVVMGSPFWGVSDHKPYRDRPIYQRGGAYIPAGSGMIVSLPEPGPLADLAVSVEWPDNAGRVRLITLDGKTYTLKADDQDPGRLKVQASAGTVLDGFTLKGTQPFRLQGLSLDKSQVTRWPWDRGVVLKTVPSSSSVETREVRFDSTRMNPLGLQKMKVLDDRGSSVLFRIAE